MIISIILLSLQAQAHHLFKATPNYFNTRQWTPGTIIFLVLAALALCWLMFYPAFSAKRSQKS